MKQKAKLYSHYVGKSCLFSALKVVAGGFDIDMPEYIAHCLSVGWEVAYQPHNIGEELLLFPGIQKAVTQFACRCGLTMKSLGTAQNTDSILQLLLGDYIAIAVVNPNVLPYMERTFDNIITQEMHVIILTEATLDGEIQFVDPYMVDRKGSVKSYIGLVDINFFVKHVQQCYILSKTGNPIPEPRQLLIGKIRGFIKGKTYNWIEKRAGVNTLFGMPGCMELFRTWNQHPHKDEDLVYLAFLIKTNFYYTLDFIHDILQEQDHKRKSEIEQEIQKQKHVWNQIYYCLLRSGYRKKGENKTNDIVERIVQELDHFANYLERLTSYV